MVARWRAWWKTRSDLQQRNTVLVAFVMLVVLVVAVAVIAEAAD